MIRVQLGTCSIMYRAISFRILAFLLCAHIVRLHNSNFQLLAPCSARLAHIMRQIRDSPLLKLLIKRNMQYKIPLPPPLPFLQPQRTIDRSHSYSLKNARIIGFHKSKTSCCEWGPGGGRFLGRDRLVLVNGSDEKSQICRRQTRLSMDLVCVCDIGEKNRS